MPSAFGINIECSWRERKKNGRRSAHHSASERNEMAIVTNVQNWLSANAPYQRQVNENAVFLFIIMISILHDYRAVTIETESKQIARSASRIR